MNHLRAVLKLFFMGFYTGISYLLYVPFYLISLLTGRSVAKARNVYMYFWSRAMSMILNMKVEITGNVPTPPFFIVSNHLSYIDTVPIFYALKTTFIAKQEVKKWPVIGFMVSSFGVIFIDRNKKKDVSRVNRAVSEQLNSDQGVVLFPEGTTSSGETLLPFRPSLLEHPASEGIPVHYAVIHYETSGKDVPASDSVCWWGDSQFHTHLYKMALNRKIKATITFGSEPVYHEDRKELSQMLYSNMNQLFIPVKQIN
jgi:1-acyl-sn-glycerol-3-phosphate acyltransferase